MQEAYTDSRPTMRTVSGERLLRTSNGEIWAPDPAVHLQLRLCITVHSGRSGHRTALSTEGILNKNFTWLTFSSEVKTFIRSSLHCLSSVGAGNMSPSFDTAVHDTAPNDLLQFGFTEKTAAATRERTLSCFVMIVLTIVGSLRLLTLLLKMLLVL